MPIVLINSTVLKATMKDEKVSKELVEDELAMRIMDALRSRDLSHQEIIALGDNPRHAATVLNILQSTGIIETYCGPIQPSTCMYKLSTK
jgi:hypothetical protein